MVENSIETLVNMAREPEVQEQLLAAGLVDIFSETMDAPSTKIRPNAATFVFHLS